MCVCGGGGDLKTNQNLHLRVKYQTNLLKSLSLASAWSTLEAPMRLERAAESVAANTPRAISSGRMLIYFMSGRERERERERERKDDD